MKLTVQKYTMKAEQAGLHGMNSWSLLAAGGSVSYSVVGAGIEA